MTVGFVTNPAALGHDAGHRGHPERAERIVAITQHLERVGLLDAVAVQAADPADVDVIDLAHGYREVLVACDRDGGGRFDNDTSMGPGSLEAALRGTQGAIDAAWKVTSGEWTSAFVCTRPPGHHATPDRPMGFCLTNHVAIAARSVGLERVAIVDWDAHHGNGTQDIFWDDPSVLYVSWHQFPWYPGTGDATETGGPNAGGNTVNIPLPAGTAEDAFDRSWDEIVAPALHRFDPQLVLLSAGFDAHHQDPLCMLRLTSGGFFRLGQRLAEAGPGPVAVLEGGYDLEALAWGSAALLSALLGFADTVGVPEGELGRLAPDGESDRWIDRTLRLLAASG